MNFDLGEDEAMLKALGERFVTDRYDGDRRRTYLAEPEGFSAENWALLGELGLIEAVGGGQSGTDGLSAGAIAVLFEVLGRGLVVEPLIESVLVAARLFSATAPAELRSKLLPSLLSGERRIALAHAEPNSRPGRIRIEAKATPVAGGFSLSGRKACSPSGQGTDGFIVSANGAGGTELYFVPVDSLELRQTPWRMADGSAAVNLELDAVTVPHANKLNGGLEAIEATDVLANLARGAEALGIMERLFADTLEYLRTREQFGSKLGSFQAIQHRMAMQYAVLEQARGLLNLALVSEGTENFANAVAGLRAFVGPASIMLGHEMIQFHGGMGVTDELAIGHGHKRLLVLSRWPDDPDSALDKFAGIAA